MADSDFLLDDAAGRLWDQAGRAFDPTGRRWLDVTAQPTGRPADALAAARWVQKQSGAPCRAPVGVIGARDAPQATCRLAETLGRGLADLGAVVICGGKGGIMAAACQGVAAGGGLSIGLLPDSEWSAANDHVTVPIATGIGVARNAIIARAALCLVAVGGGYGTLSEMAYGLQFGRPVFSLGEAPVVAGATPLEDVEQALDAVARVLIAVA